MKDSGTILWEDEAVGTVANIMPDMWYLDADWKPNHSDVTSRFEELASKQRGDEGIKEPSKGMVAVLKYDEAPSDSHHVLILSVDNSKLFMRSISDEVAMYADRKFLVPWQPTKNPAFYETELKREVNFFHPLNRENVRAIANRMDRDDVLFEVLNGKSTYAVVHLTWRKERSRTFPATTFYKDWHDVCVNGLLEDNKKWKADPCS